VFNAWRLEETKPLKQRETLAVRSRIYIYSKLEKANKKETRQIFVDRARYLRTLSNWDGKVVTTINTYIKTKKHSPVDPSILEPVYRQGGAP
jgi:hypothetical protein